MQVGQSFSGHWWLLFFFCVLGDCDILKHQVVDRSWTGMGDAEVTFTEERRARLVAVDCFTSTKTLKCWEGAGDLC